MALLFPFLGQAGLSQRWASRVWCSEHRGQVGTVCLQRGVAWPNSQQLRHWVAGEEAYILSHLRLWEKRRKGDERDFTVSRETARTTEVVGFWARSSGLFWRKWAEGMGEPLQAYLIASDMIAESSVLLSPNAWGGRPWMTMSTSVGARQKVPKGFDPTGSASLRTFVRRAKYGRRGWLGRREQ